MKAVWIVLGVLFALGLLCCGGFFLLGRNIVRSVAEVNDQADKFALKVVSEAGKDWNPAVLRQYGTDEFKSVVSEDQLATRMKTYAKKLGPLKSCKEFTASNTSSNYVNGKTVVTVHTSAQAVFEKGTGTVDISVAKDGDKWGVVGFEVSSDALVGN